MTILQLKPLAKRAAWGMAAAIVFVYLYGLGRLPFLGPDEPRYAQVGREMWARGDWVTPTLGGHVWFEKPSLLYWLEMLSYQLFGVSEGAARLGPALCGLLTVGLMFAAGRRDRDSVNGLWVGVVAATSLGLLAFARAASFDIVLTATVAAAMVCFWYAETTPAKATGKRQQATGKNYFWDAVTWGRSRMFWQAAFYVCLGLATLAKGLAGLILPAGIIFFYFALRRAWPERDWWLSVLWGVPLMLATAATWYAPVISRNGWHFVDEFFIQHHFARYTSNKFKHPQPFWFFVPVMAALALPWTPFIGAEIRDLLRWRKVATAQLSWDKGRVLAWAWLVWPVLFFSLSGSKLPGYVLPALPGAAWLAGRQVARWQQDTDVTRNFWAARITAVLFLLAGVGTVVYAKLTGLVGLGCAVGVAVPLLVAGVWVLVRPKSGVAAWLMAGAVLWGFAWPLHCDLSAVIRQETVRELLRESDARGYGALPVYHLHAIEHGSWFYANGRVAADEKGVAVKFESVGELRAVLDKMPVGASVLTFIPVEHLRQITQTKELQSEVIGNNGWIALVKVTKE